MARSSARTAAQALSAATGAAQNFVQLFLARMAVGMTDAAAIPTSNALIADYFPPKKGLARSRCLQQAARLVF